MCDCHARIDAKLAPLNGKLATGFSCAPDGKTPGMHLTLLMQIEKISPRGKKPPHVLPTFCPFCGEGLHSSVARTVKRKKGRPAHMGHIEKITYTSEAPGQS